MNGYAITNAVWLHLDAMSFCSGKQPLDKFNLQTHTGLSSPSHIAAKSVKEHRIVATLRAPLQCFLATKPEAIAWPTGNRKSG